MSANAYIALPEPVLHDFAGSEYETQHGHVRTDHRDSDELIPQQNSEIRLRSGFMNAIRSLATSTMVIGITIVLVACVTFPTPKLSPLPSIIVVAVFAALTMMAVAILIIIRDDRVEQWAPNLLFLVIITLFFTVAAMFVAFLYRNPDKFATIWNSENAEHRHHLMNQLNQRRPSLPVTEEVAKLVITTEDAMISLLLMVLCLVLFAIQMAIVFPLSMVQYSREDLAYRTSRFVLISRRLQDAGLI